jgi:hypothetical protein
MSAKQTTSLSFCLSFYLPPYFRSIAGDALHFMIFDGMGERSPDQSNWRYGLDLHNHRKARNDSWANTFFHHENMLDWLGVTIYVSRPKTYPIIAPKDPLFEFSSSEIISQDMQSDTAPNGKTTISIQRSVINRWLTDKRRLRKGRFNSEFSKLILWLAEDYKTTMADAKAPRICVSVCGAHHIAAAAQTCIATAKNQGLKVEVEFVSETQ